MLSPSITSSAEVPTVIFLLALSKTTSFEAEEIVVESIVHPAIIAEVATSEPASVTLKGADAGVTFPAQKRISSPTVTAEDNPVAPVVSVIDVALIVQPPIRPDVADMDPLKVPLAPVMSPLKKPSPNSTLPVIPSILNPCTPGRYSLLLIQLFIHRLSRVFPSITLEDIWLGLVISLSP